jgi:hypothetical protein
VIARCKASILVRHLSVKMKPPAVPAGEHAGPRNGYGDSVNLTLAVPAEIVEKQVNFSLFPIR